MNRQMSKEAEERRKQSEFWFVFNNDPDQVRPALDSGEEDHPGKGNDCTTLISEDVLKKHRDKLIAELHEFGC